MKKFLIIFILGFLNSCMSPMLDIDAARNFKSTGNVFNDVLREEYVNLAEYRLEQGDKLGAQKYLNKANIIANNIIPEMETVYTRKIELSVLTELLGAKYFTEAAFVNGAKNIVPDISAIAQASFDCWVEQEEDKQTDIRMMCKKDFNQARGTLSKVMRDIKIREAKVIEEKQEKLLSNKEYDFQRRLAIQKAKLFKLPEPSLIFFQTNSTKIGITGKNILVKVAQDIKKFKPRKVVISGHTDYIGSYKNNMRLAMKRGRVVEKYLTEKMGIPTYLIDVKAYGENNPRDSKGKHNNVRNRYVKIKLLKDNRVYY